MVLSCLLVFYKNINHLFSLFLLISNALVNISFLVYNMFFFLSFTLVLFSIYFLLWTKCVECFRGINNWCIFLIEFSSYSSWNIFLLLFNFLFHSFYLFLYLSWFFYIFIFFSCLLFSIYPIIYLIDSNILFCVHNMIVPGV